MNVNVSSFLYSYIIIFKSHMLESMKDRGYPIGN